MSWIIKLTLRLRRLGTIVMDLKSALHFNYASAEAARIAFGQRGAEDVVAAQLKQAAVEALKVGSIITARYRYRVGDDGALSQLQTQITADAPDDESGSGAARRDGRASFLRHPMKREPEFSDLAQPRPQLSPADELSIFAVPAQSGINRFVDRSTNTPPRAGDYASLTFTDVEAIDAKGQQITAEIIVPQTQQHEDYLLKLTPRVQFSVAMLYARNSDIIYNVTPITRLAA